MELDKIKIIKTLGSGMFGTTYLAKYKGKKYAYKIQKILEKAIKPNIKYGIWRELYFYNFINHMTPGDAMFLVKLHDYKIIKNCEHIQSRPYEPPPESDLGKELHALDKSRVCVAYLTEYKGNMTLHEFLGKKILQKILYSIFIQVCITAKNLCDSGYARNDIHPGNIMINKTDKLTYTSRGRRIHFNGYIISLIDYGEVLSKKYSSIYRPGGMGRRFLKNKKQYCFDEIFYFCMEILTCVQERIKICKMNGQKIPRQYNYNVHDAALEILIKDHNDFYTKHRDKYMKLFPRARSFLLSPGFNVNDVKKQRHSGDIKNVLYRISVEFSIAHPDDYQKYWKWCSLPRFLVPSGDIRKFMGFTTIEQLIDYLYEFLH